MYLSAGGFAIPKGGTFTPLGEAVHLVTEEEEVRREIQELVVRRPTSSKSGRTAGVR
jgi:hypothetical protein